ncbi:MAG: hypothetical protein QNJ38_08760 [Prochloraceae cyanobacterium]|nr:hypothetical protein [Prochloraceae cyanobacterium]
MAVLNAQKNKKVNPKKQKRKVILDVGKPKFPLPKRSQQLQQEQLKDWESAS